MKVLFFSEMFPKPGSPSSGIFIIRRLEALKQMEQLSFDFAPVSTEDSLFMVMIKSLFKRSSLKLPKYLELNSRKFSVIKVPIHLKERFGILKNSTSSWLKYSELMAKYIEQNFQITAYDLIHAHRAFPEGYAALKLSRKYRVPYIVTAHGSEIHSLAENLSPYLVETLECSSKSIFVSRFLLNKAIEFEYSGKNAVVIPNGYDPEIFQSKDKEKVRKELGIYKEETKYVGFVGNLKPIKRADKLPEIFGNILKETNNVRFIIVGDGELRDKIKRQMKGMDVIFTGRVPQEEVVKYMNAMDIMILPSRNEGWPCVVLEAQSCGTCVVGSSNGGIPEAIGFSDYVVHEGEGFGKRFAQRVVEILKKEYDRNIFIERAKNFTWKEIARREMNVYEKLL